MPITFSQSELKADEDTRHWMRAVYAFLAAKPDSAYYREELVRLWPELEAGRPEHDRFLEALAALTALGALEAKEIEGVMFYIFRRDFDSATWKPLAKSAR